MRKNETPEEIPVYMFMGFLESGKTTFAKETLIDRDFTDGDKTLLLICEDGIEEYDFEELKKRNIFAEYIDEENLNTDYLIDLQDKYEPERVMIEYNGTWKLEKLFNIRVPKGWTVIQVITFVNSQTFDAYLKNMKMMIMDHLTGADMIVINRCDDKTDKDNFRKTVKSVNRRAQIVFEGVDGLAEVDEGELILPYDVEKDHIELNDEDFGIFYIDAADNPEKYEGKTISFKAMVYKPKQYGKTAFVPGRFAMTCCADDVTFIGFKCNFDKAKYLKDRSWVHVEAKIRTEFYPDFGGDGPVLDATEVRPDKPAEEDLVYFN
ncbi:MAG: GTPase [Lachnospiraceae bacterium]|nr:GTPase [Lachnospiraceae bacterium]